MQSLGLMKDHGQQARAIKFIKMYCKSGRGVSKSTGSAKFSLALVCWPWSLISPGSHHIDSVTHVIKREIVQGR